MAVSRPVAATMGVLVAAALVVALPLLVDVRLGARPALVFGVGWVFGVLLVAVAAGTAWWRVRTREQGPGAPPVHDAARGALERGLTVVVPVVVVLLVASPWILSVLGAAAQDTGVGALFAVVLAAVPAAVVAVGVRVAVVLGRTVTAFVLPLVVLLLALGFSWVSTPWVGVFGAGLGWLLSQSAVAVVVLVWARVGVTRPHTIGA